MRGRKLESVLCASMIAGAAFPATVVGQGAPGVACATVSAA